MLRAQKLPQELEKQLAELGVLEQHIVEELRKTKEDRDATVSRLEKEIADLKVNEVLAKMSSIEEYKSSYDFQEAVEQAASRYFGEGFNLCKKQIGHLHLELDMQDMEIDSELAREEEEGEEEEENEEKDEERGDQDTSPLSP